MSYCANCKDLLCEQNDAQLLTDYKMPVPKPTTTYFELVNSRLCQIPDPIYGNVIVFKTMSGNCYYVYSEDIFNKTTAEISNIMKEIIKILYPKNPERNIPDKGFRLIHNGKQVANCYTEYLVPSVIDGLSDKNEIYVVFRQ